jgi:G:T/U-mismatch repair DNA glycosylase
MSWKKPDKYEIEEHPFETFVPENAKFLIIGTFPTHSNNHRFNFFYSGKDNLFWSIIEQVFRHTFQHDTGNKAAEERKAFLKSEGIGITDMHEKCYRKNGYSTDENLFPIILKDIFAILDEHTSLKRIILTSRTEVFGALGLLKTYFLQKGLELEQPEKRTDKVLEGGFIYHERAIEVLVPYSPSPRLIEKGTTTMEELVKMYRHCLT